MIFRKILFFGGIFSLTGCVSMLTHIKMDDESMRATGMQIAVVDACMNKGYLSDQIGNDFKAALANLMSVSVYSKESFSAGYSLGLREAEANAQLLPVACAEARTGLASLIPKLQARYQEISVKRGSDLRDMNRSLTNYQVPSPPTYAPMNLKKPQFGQQPAPKTYHFNGAGGPRSCTVTSSGVVVCP